MKFKLILITVMLASSAAQSQRLKTPTLSPSSKITQQIGLTEISVEYARPSAKGRVVFGGLVPYGKIWRTGANASTKITLIEAAKIGGNDIDAGTYALYTIPGEASWTIIIHGNTKMRSLAGDVYNKADDIFRFEVTAQKTSRFIETFTLEFADIAAATLNLVLSWENTYINIPIAVEVDDKISAQMTASLKDSSTIPHRTYFEAAQYYLNNGKDLDKAESWINEALVKSPKNFRYGLLKSKIQHKTGNDKAAVDSINKANAWAVEAKNANYIEQTELYRDELIKKTTK